MPAYEMRIGDWMSDVCSSDLKSPGGRLVGGQGDEHGCGEGRVQLVAADQCQRFGDGRIRLQDDRLGRHEAAGGIGAGLQPRSIGRASCRARVGPYGQISGVAGEYKNKSTIQIKMEETT